MTGLCGAALRHASVFYGILEFLQAGFTHHTRACFVRRSRGMGICEISLSWKKDTLYLIHCPYANAVSGDDGFQLSCTKQTEAD